MKLNMQDEPSVKYSNLLQHYIEKTWYIIASVTSKQAKIIALEFLQSKPVIMYNNQRTKTEQNIYHYHRVQRNQHFESYTQ